jgi:acetyltransferase-like isoleucine patch superfamily enzyme
LILGENSGFSNTIIHAHNYIKIGNYVNIGAGCLIFDTNFHSLDWNQRSDRVLEQESVITKPITINDYAFIGAKCIIMKGVTIGLHSIIAAGSVVVNDIPDDELWGGNPARFIKKITDKNMNIG